MLKSSFLRIVMITLGLSSISSAAKSQSTWAIGTGNWSTAANWLPNGVPTSGATTSLIFNHSGATSYTSTNDIGAFTLNSLTINNTSTGTVTVSASAAANALTFAGTTPTIRTTGSGITVFTGYINGTATDTIDYNGGPGEFRMDAAITSTPSTFTGTLNVNSGTFRNQSSVVAVTNFNASSIVVNNGATYIFGNAGVGDPNLPNSTYITANTGGTVRWEEGETYGGFNLFGGTVNLIQGGMTLSGAFPTVVQVGSITGPNGIGGAAAINKTSAGTVTVTSVNISTTGGLNIQDGVLSTNTGFTGVGPVNLGATTFSPVYRFRGTTALSTTRPLTILGDGGTIQVEEATGNVTMTAAVTLGGNLTKTGPGSLTVASTTGAGDVDVSAGSLIIGGLAGHTGATRVSASALARFNPNATVSTTNVIVSQGGTFAVNSGAGTQSFTTSAANLSFLGGAAVRLELATSTLPTAPLLTITNVDGLNLQAATQTLNIPNSLNYPTGTFTAIDYNGTPITTGFNLTLSGRTAGTLIYNTANTSIDVTITGSDSIKWGGQVNNTWDLGTAINVGGTNNFRLNSNNNNTNFIQSDSITFDNSAATFTPTLDFTALPSAVIFNNTTTYAISGSGGIGGSTSVTKNNTGTVILATNNSYTGGTTVNAGTLQLGDGGTSGSITGTVSLAGNTTLIVNRSDATSIGLPITIGGAGVSILSNGTGAATIATGITLGTNDFTFGGSGPLTFGAVISGTGTLTKVGAGTTTLLGASTGFTGTLNVNAGVVILNDAGASGDLNAVAINANNGGTFQFAVFPTTGNTDLPDSTFVNVNPGGTVIWNEGEQFGGFNMRGGTYQARASLTLVDVSIGSDWQSGTMTALTAPASNQGVGGAGFINKTTSGTLTLTGINITNTGFLNIQQGTLATDAALSGTGIVSLGDGATQVVLNLTGITTPTMNRPLTLTGTGIGQSTIRVDDAAGIKTYSGIISGTTGVLTKTGPGQLILTGFNTYGGGTTISGGSVFVNGQAGVNSGTGSGPVTVQTGATFGGNGRAAGAITVDAGATITAGTTPATNVLTAGSTVALNGRYLVNLFGTGSTEASRINAGGNVTLGTTSTLQLGLSGITVDGLRSAVGVGNTQVYTIVDAGTNTRTGTFNTTDFTSAGFEASEWLVSYNTNSITLNFTPVPEPVTVLGFGALAMFAGAAVRRRRK